MSSGKNQYLSQKVLNYIFNGGAFTQPTTLFLALFTTTPTVSSGGTEATGSGYARISVTCNTTNWPTISGSTTTMTSGAQFSFPTATGNWSSSANMNGAGILDSVTLGAGNLLYFGDLTTPTPILNGNTASFASGAVTVQEL